MSAKGKLRDDLAKATYAAMQADAGRRIATLYLLALIMKMGGRLTLTKADTERITKDFALAENIDEASGTIQLACVVEKPKVEQ